jgi:tRNA A-37 threonylcarbamoyl transferase component Bud32
VDLDGPRSAVLPNRYRVERMIGRGGAAVVYAAHDLLLDRPVAVKAFLAQPTDAASLAEQESEARTLAGLSHHGLVTLYDAGVDDSDPAHPHIYLVMERVDGPDLAQRLRSGPLSPRQVAYLGMDLSDALAYVHERGYLHRDIKPANVLLSARGADHRLRGKLSDFGIATLAGAVPPVGEFTVGTAAYLSPEQARGVALTTASDTYALGLVLLEAATGSIAFPGGVVESAFSRLERDPEVPSSLPPSLAEVLRGMTAQNPRLRMSLLDARNAFEQFLVEQLDRRPAAPPSSSPNEAHRAEVQEHRDLLQSPPDVEFDRLARMAARQLHARGAVVSTAEGGQVWAKARNGVEEPEARVIGELAAAVLEHRSPMIVPDILADRRTAGSTVTAGGTPVRFFAGLPLALRDGSRLGTLAVVDVIPRDLDGEALQTLRDIADIAVHELELRLATRRALFAR